MVVIVGKTPVTVSADAAEELPALLLVPINTAL
jgi:hypothetical protein